MLFGYLLFQFEQFLDNHEGLLCDLTLALATIRKCFGQIHLHFVGLYNLIYHIVPFIFYHSLFDPCIFFGINAKFAWNDIKDRLMVK